MSYDLRTCPLSVVRTLCERFHGYGGAGGSATYAFAVYENGEPVAAYSWQPPPPGAAFAVSPEFPQGVLALSSDWMWQCGVAKLRIHHCIANQWRLLLRYRKR